ncbi:MAG: LPS-assembly lipoprotein [Francisella sp.]|jgi:LPS-assembly lipoprotein
MVMKKYFVLVFVLLSAACGFHPRGVIIDGDAGNFGSIIGAKFFIEDNNFSSYANELRRSLISYKADVVSDDKDADYIINLQNVAKTSQMTSVVGGASNNTYQLKLTVAYNIVRPDVEEPIIPNKTLSNQQFWQSNAGVVLSQSNEANRQYDYLQGQLINNMLNQIAALLPAKDSSTDSSKDSSTNKSKKKTNSTANTPLENVAKESSTEDNS